jgi:hypothetical protein
VTSSVQGLTGKDGVCALLALLFPSGAEGYLEIRSISQEGEPATEFWKLPAGSLPYFAVENKIASGDFYVSVAPRVRRRGTKADVEAVHVVWVDLDQASAAADLAGFELQPSAVVSTGSEGHCHAYWALSEPIGPDVAEQLNRALAAHLGGDPAVVDAARVMRMPGTYNFKHKPPVKSELASCGGAKYQLGDLEAALSEQLQPLPTSNGSARQARKNQDPVELVLDKLEGVRTSGNGWQALCPAHDDHSPSLAVAEGKDGSCLLHCFAGCATEKVAEALGLQMSDLFPETVRGKKSSTRLVHLAEQAGIEVFHTKERAGYAAVEVDGHRETRPLRSDGFGLWLRRLHYEATEESVGDEVLAEAIATLEAQALFKGEQRKVYRRVAGLGERILIDLGDEEWRAIEVSPDGWDVIENPDAHFVRDSTAQALPLPVRGGSIEELRDFANCANEGSWLRLLGSLVMCLNPHGPYPVIYPTGEQGSAKSTLSRLVSSLVDPRGAPLQMGNPSTRDLAVLADNVWLVGFDNVSKVSPALSDALCQLATGGGYRTRKLYTDGDSFVLDLKRPVLLNGIGQVIERPDLLDRVALIELAPIPPEQRRTEADLEAAWEKARPRIFGAILDGLVAAVGGGEEVELEGFPRMADFARWGEAAGAAFGWPAGAFTAALEGSRQELLEGSAEAHPEIAALLKLMEEKAEWTGSASELLEALAAEAGESPAASRAWPKGPDVLSNRLIEHAPLLRTRGLEVARGREGGGKRNRFLQVTKKRDAGTRGDAR